MSEMRLLVCRMYIKANTITKPVTLLRNISWASDTDTDIDFAMTSARVATKIAKNIRKTPISE